MQGLLKKFLSNNKFGNTLNPIVTEPAAKRYTTFVMWVMALCPMLLVGLVLAATLRLRGELGHWPVPMIDDGYSSIAGYATAFAGLFIVTLILALPFWFMVLLSSADRVSLPHRVALSSAYVSGWVLLVLYCWIDPWRFIEWFLD